MSEFISLIESLPDESKNCIKEMFMNAPYWLIDSFQVISLPKEHMFIEENQPSNMVYILVSGKVKATDYQVLNVIYDYTWFEPVEIFGAMEFFMDKDKYITSLKTMTECKFLRISRHHFEKWLMSDVSILMSQTKKMLYRLNEQGEKERIFLFLQGIERIYYIFIRLYEMYGSNGTCSIKYTKEEIANYSGVNIRTVTRVLRKLANENYITKDGRRIVITEVQYTQFKNLLIDKVYLN